MKLLKTGLYADRNISSGLAEKISLTNLYIVSVLSYFATYFFIYAYLGQSFVSQCMAVGFFAGSLAIYLNHLGHFYTSRYLFLITCNLMVCIADICFKFEIHAEVYYLPSTLISFLIFEHYDQKHIALAVSWPVLFWFFPRFFNLDQVIQVPALSENNKILLNYFNYFGSIVLTNYFAFSFFKSLSDFQKAIVTSNKFSALGEMSAGIAHEINNPLAIILGKAQQMRKKIMAGSAEISALEADLQKIENTTQRIAKIVKGLRSFSRTGEADSFVLTPLSVIVEDVLGLCQERLKANGIEIQVHISPDHTILCRENQIGQVLVNLIGNATDAIAKMTNPWIRIETHMSNESLQLHFIDSGQGIAPHIVDKMMNPFFTTKDVGKGTGLGLSISKGILEDHGGKLIYDAKSKNTKFILNFPIAKNSEKNESFKNAI